MNVSIAAGFKIGPLSLLVCLRQAGEKQLVSDGILIFHIGTGKKGVIYSGKEKALGRP